MYLYLLLIIYCNIFAYVWVRLGMFGYVCLSHLRSFRVFGITTFAFIVHLCIVFKKAIKSLLTMQTSDFSYIPIEQLDIPQTRRSQVGKWVKKQYVEQFGEIPMKLPHKMVTPNGHTVNTAVHYYPSPWLKALFKVN